MTYLYSKMSREQVTEFLAEPRHGVLGTVSSWGDKQAQLNTVWWLYEDGRIWLSFYEWSNKLRNIEQDPRVCLCIPTPYPEADKQVILYGAVDRISKQGDPEYDEALDYRMTQQFSVSEEIARKVHAADLKDGPWVQLSFKPNRIIADDYDSSPRPVELTDRTG